MAEQGNPDSGDGQASIQPLPPLVKAYIDEQVENAIRQHDQAQTKVKKWRNSWRSASPITKASFWLTAFIAGGTIAYAITAWRELDAMKSISGDNTRQTQQLIDAANQIKAAAWQFKGSAQGIDGNVGNAVEKLRDQVTQVRRSADAATSAAKTAKDTLIASNRPWLVADVQLVGPLHFYKDGGFGLGVRYSLKNVGHSPAIKAWADLDLILPHNPETEPNLDRDKVCDRSTQRALAMGQSIFPSGIVPDVTTVVGIGANSESVKKGQIGSGFINPAVILCIAYQTTLDDNWHHTGMIFEVFNGEKGIRHVIKVGQDVPPESLGVSLSPFHGVLAD